MFTPLIANRILSFIKAILIAGVFILPYFVLGQTKTILPCDSFSPIIAEQIAAYGKFDDSMDRMIEVWRKNSCGWTEPVTRLLLLRALHKNDTNEVQEYFHIYYEYYYGHYLSKMRHSKTFHLFDTTNKHDKKELNRLIKEWGYVPPGSNYDSWTKSLAGQPTINNVRTTDVMCAARLMLADSSGGSFGLVLKVYRKSRHETIANLVDTIRYWDEKRTAITLSANLLGVFSPIGTNRVPPSGISLLSNYYIGIKRRNNSVEAHVGWVGHLLNKKFTDNNGIDRKVERIWNYQVLLAHKFKIQYPYEGEIGLGAGKSELVIANWDKTNNTITQLPNIYGVSPTIRLRFYRYNNTDIRIGIELKYQWVDYNGNNPLSTPIGKHYLFLGLVMRY